jgi:hypothetical protein
MGLSFFLLASGLNVRVAITMKPVCTRRIFISADVMQTALGALLKILARLSIQTVARVQAAFPQMGVS